MAIVTEANIKRPRYYGLFWRWHFFAALIVIPFVLWQCTTGTLYLWSEWATDTLHPELRFVADSPQHALPSTQIAAALATVPASAASAADLPMAGMHMGGPMQPTWTKTGAKQAPVTGQPVLSILLSDDPHRSTAVLLQSASGLAYPVFVDPHTARVLGSLPAAAWWPGWSRSLHGGWPIGKPGSWLLELGDCWAIVMILTGFYMWWPRTRPFPELLWPRFCAGPRALLRDLHSTVAVLFSAVFLFFLISALPWTAFWGGELLSRVETATGQSSPAPFSNGGASASQVMSGSSSLDEAVREARARGVKGTLDIRLSPWADAPWWIANVHTPALDHTLQASRTNGSITDDVTNAQMPAIPRFVALGIHIHQGDFGLLNLWLNTAFAFSLIWLVVTGIASWWIRRPKRRLGAPPATNVRWPHGLVAGAVAMAVALPIFGLSVILIAGADRLFRLSVGTQS